MAISNTAGEGRNFNQSVSAGDRESIEQLIREQYDGIHRLARHFTRSHDDAADLAQITFIKACSKLDRFDGRSTMRAWLAGILYHEFLHWRRAKRWASLLQDDHSSDPTDGILTRESLLAAIHHLPPKLRDTFLLVEVHGFSLSEVSIALKVPEGTLKSRLSSARANLRKQLNHEERDEI